MKLSIKNSIYQAIIHNQWLAISYVNKKNEVTDYYIGIKDIDIDKGVIKCDIFNPFKSNKVIQNNGREVFIYISSIKSATILNQSYYETPLNLFNKINISNKYSWDSAFSAFFGTLKGGKKKWQNFF